MRDMNSPKDAVQWTIDQLKTKCGISKNLEHQLLVKWDKEVKAQMEKPQDRDEMIKAQEDNSGFTGFTTGDLQPRQDDDESDEEETNTSS